MIDDTVCDGAASFSPSPDIIEQLRHCGFNVVDLVSYGQRIATYRCLEIALQRTVLAKVFVGDSDEERNEFVRYQKKVGRITPHPNVIAMLRLDETALGCPYVILEYHEDEPLDKWVRNNSPLSAGDALRVALKILGALDSAHRMDVAHGNVAPQNIVIRHAGEPRLCNFGDAYFNRELPRDYTGLIQPPPFIAPEIFEGGDPTAASDVYGLAVTLLYMIAGDGMKQDAEQVASLSASLSSVPEEVSTLVEWAMAHNPADRPTASCLANDILRVQPVLGLEVTKTVGNGSLGGWTRSDPEPNGGPRICGNIPAELSNFIGRAREVATIERKLESEARLVTLTGMGGVGKTRLAIRTASNIRKKFKDGAWLVELAEVTDGASLVEAIAATLGIRHTPDLREQVIDYLSTRELLLLLDNCEQIVDDVAKVADALLRRCPRLSILATSREALFISGEHLLRLSPLPYQVDDTSDPGAALRECDAVALFVDRAQLARLDFTLTRNNIVTIENICSRLDGIPLAIELAAARLKLMSPENILESLLDSYALVMHGPRTAPPRQQTLNASIQWSFGLCTADEQQLWQRLSVFADYFDAVAAHSICCSSCAQPEFTELLSSLVDKSILIAQESISGMKFRFLQAVRAYGRQQITSASDELELLRRHAEWYRRLADCAASEWIGPTQVDWIRRLESDLNNLRASFEFLLDDDPRQALSMAVDLAEFWFSRGRLGEARRWLGHALEASPLEPSVDRITAHFYAAAYSGLDGDPASSLAHSLAADDLASDQADPFTRALLDASAGFAALFAGDMNRACEMLQTAIEPLDGFAGQLGTLVLLTLAYEARGDAAAAEACTARLLTTTETRGEATFRSLALLNRGIADWQQCDEKVVALLRKGAALGAELDDPLTSARFIEVLAWVNGRIGEHFRAVVMMSAARGLARTVDGVITPLPLLAEYHKACEEEALGNLGQQGFLEAQRMGSEMGLTDALSFVCGLTHH